MSTVANLLADIKIKGQIQADGTVLSDADILSIANKQLQSVIVPKILSVRQNYFWTFKDYALGANTRIRLPSRRIGGRFTAAIIKDGNSLYSFNKKHQNQISGRRGYQIQGDQLFISNPYGDIPSGNLRIQYQCRPPTMVSGAASLATVSTVGTSSLTLSASLSVGSYELIRPNGNQNTIFPAISASGVTATNPDDLLGDSYTGMIQVGDVVIAQDSTHLVPLPLELHDWLAQRTVMRIKQYLGHKQEMQLAGAKLADMQKDGLALLTPRAQSDEKVFVDKEILNWKFW